MRRSYAAITSSRSRWKKFTLNSSTRYSCMKYCIPKATISFTPVRDERAVMFEYTRVVSSGYCSLWPTL